MKVFKFIVAILTALTALVGFGVGMWSLFTGLPVVITIVSLLFGVMLSVLTYVDVRNLLKKQ